MFLFTSTTSIWSSMIPAQVAGLGRARLGSTGAERSCKPIMQVSGTIGAARSRATTLAAGPSGESLRRRGVLGALQLALSPDRPRDEHNDDADDSKDHFAAMPAIGELRRHAERFEQSIEADTDRTVEEPMQRWLYRRVRRHHLAGDPAEQARAGPYQRRKPRQQRHDQRGTRDDQGNADGESEDKQRNTAVGGGSNRDDVVEAHDDVG